MHRSLILTLSTLALAVAGCGSDSDGDTAAPEGAQTTTTAQAASPTTTTTATERPAAQGTRIRLADSQYGKVVFDGSGQAIYLFDKEKSNKSLCTGECAAAWPPVVTKGEPTAVSGIDQSLLGTTQRPDGKTQVTYNGHPLYYYAHEGRNEVRCHNVEGFGGLWLAVSGRGNAVA